MPLPSTTKENHMISNLKKHWERVPSRALATVNSSVMGISS